MLTFLKKRQKFGRSNEIEKFIGKWKLDHATILYFGKEMELEPDEFEIIEDSLNSGLFIITGFTFSYSGNRLFPSHGAWQLISPYEIKLFANDQNFKLHFENEQLIYQLRVDEYICYSIYFKKAITEQ